MNAARQQLLERFRSSGIERLRKIALELGEHKSRAAPLPPEDSVLRDLHTIKGEARLLGLRAVSTLLHELEELLRPDASRASDASPDASPDAAIEGALRIVDRLVSALTDTPMDDAELRRVLSPAEAEPAPPSETEPDSASETPHVVEPVTPSDQRWVHVNLQRIDELCDGTAELENTFRALFAQAQTTLGAKAPNPRALRALFEELERYRAQFDDVTSMVWALRLVPIEPLLVELAYHGDELARGQRKRVHVRVQSGSAQLERGILDALREPLVHLIRNAIDHGIERADERGSKPEEASLLLRAESSGSTVVLTIADDGRGVDLNDVRAAAIERSLMSSAAAAALSEAELYSLLFRQGFSTRSRVTDLSGRGVGLDVVRSTIETLGGTVELHTTAGAGTTFRLALPMRLSRERALVFGYQGLLHAIPARQVLDLVNLRDQTVCEIVGGTALRYRDSVLPLSSMATTLGIPTAQSTEPTEPLGVILSAGSERWAFSLGGVVGDFELVRKPCDALLTASLGYVASATLDDGRLVLYLNLADLVQRARDSRVPYKRAALQPKQRILVVDDSVIIRHLLSLVLSSGGYEVTTAEHGRQALTRIEERPPDLVVSDLDMPEMDGMEMLKRLRARWPNLPCIIFTNHDSNELRLRALALGAHEYVVKADFDQEAILHAAERVLRSRQASA